MKKEKEEKKREKASYERSSSPSKTMRPFWNLGRRRTTLASESFSEGRPRSSGSASSAASISTSRRAASAPWAPSAPPAAPACASDSAAASRTTGISYSASCVSGFRMYSRNPNNRTARVSCAHTTRHDTHMTRQHTRHDTTRHALGVGGGWGAH
jgi:hypothetical protein